MKDAPELTCAGNRIQCAFGNSKYVNEFFKNTEMSYYQIVFEKE